MATGRPPLAKAAAMGKDSRWISNELRRSPPKLTPSDGVSTELCAFVEFILQPIPANRPKATEILNHSFIRGTENSHPNPMLVDLVTAFNKWEQEGGSRNSLFLPDNLKPAEQSPAERVDARNTTWRFSRANLDDFNLEDARTKEEVDQELTAKGSYLDRRPSINVDVATNQIPSAYPNGKHSQ